MNLASRFLIGSSLLGVTALLAACSSSPSDSNAGTGGIASGATSGSANANGGNTSGGSPANGGVTTGGANSSTGGSAPVAGSSSGGSIATGGAPATGGSIGTGGANSGGAAASGGSAGSGGSSSLGGSSNSGGTPNTGGASERGGAAGNGGSSTGGKGSGGTAGSGGATGGASATGGQGGASAGGAGAFEPCPASGACKLMPLGDSITEGTGYAGGYRIELFAKAVAEQKNITFVGSLSNGPNTVSGVTFPKSHEGHYAWTISQVDDLIPDPALNVAPHIVLLHLGTNDVNQNMNSGAPERLGSLIDQIIAKLPSALIVVAKVIPQPGKASGITTFNNAVPQIVQARANAGKHVLLVDQFTGFPSSELGDGVHPNQAGYMRMAGVWYTAIKGYLH